ncbi:phosphonate ABC transporter, permease protein PhnE [Salibacterium aidingense]|uniref:phosphonate ABC transporter, permease protein PhnE n=1 Tax=Salibacterium aidingense TaxID=384933 RepID=UPI00041A0A63|nr:phosphonate ABC transporter, permease protein PhnE [Salibacterium aidingense]
MEHKQRAEMPKRWGKPSVLTWILGIALILIIVHGLDRSELTVARLFEGAGRLAEFIAHAFPPNVNRLNEVLIAAFETLEIAVIGTLTGALLSIPIALLAAQNTTPHKSLYVGARTFISFLRAIPDLVWGLIFVVAIGLGPAPGIFAITVDVIGFCGRFFSERIEEVDEGPINSLKVSGAPIIAIVTGALLPATLPSFTATTLFALEQAIRSAVVLGLVGAGGIGVELQTSMQMLLYDEALTIILIIFLIVIMIERLSAWIRSKII